MFTQKVLNVLQTKNIFELILHLASTVPPVKLKKLQTRKQKQKNKQQETNKQTKIPKPPQTLLIIHSSHFYNV